MKIIRCVIAFGFLCTTLVMGFNCIADSQSIQVQIQTCDRFEDGCCPQGLVSDSQDFNFRLDGSEDAPQLLWSLLDGDDDIFKIQFYEMYEVNAASGEMIKNSVTELNTFAWKYFSPVQSGNTVWFRAYGSKDAASILVTGYLSNPDSFEWSFRLDNYEWATGESNDLVLVFKSGAQNKDYFDTQDQGKSYDSKLASYNGNAIDVTFSSTLNLEKGYFVVFSTHGQNNSFSSLVLGPSTSSAITLDLFIGALCFAVIAALLQRSTPLLNCSPPIQH